MAIRKEINANEDRNSFEVFFFSFFLSFFFSKQNVIYFNILYICNNKSMNIINIETVAESDIKMPSIDKTLG